MPLAVMDALKLEARRAALERLVRATLEKFDEATAEDLVETTSITRVRIAHAKQIFERASVALAEVDVELGKGEDRA